MENETVLFEGTQSKSQAAHYLDTRLRKMQDLVREDKK